MWLIRRCLSFSAFVSLTHCMASQNATYMSPEVQGTSVHPTNDSKESASTPASTGLFGEAALSVVRTECFRAANLTESRNFTCNQKLLVHYSVAEFLTYHASQDMCQDHQKYGNVMECMLGVTKGCLPKENRRHFPDVVKVREGVQYICDVAKELPDVNITCAQQHFPEVFECLRKDTLLIVNDDSIKIPLQSKFICRTYDIVDLCCWEKLQTCGKNTAGAYVRLLSVYLRPPSCPSSGHMTASSSIAVLLISALVSIIWLT